MGCDILCGERGYFWHFRRRSGGGNSSDFETLRRRAGNSFRENDLRFLVAGRVDDFYLADIFNLVRCADRKFLIIGRDDFFRANRLGGGWHFDGGSYDFGDGQRRAFPDFAFPDNASDFPARNRADRIIIHGRGVRGEFANRHGDFRFDFDNGIFDFVRLFVRKNFHERNFISKS